MTLALGGALVLILVLVVLVYSQKYLKRRAGFSLSNTRPVGAPDGNLYYVHDQLGGEEAAEVLAYLNAVGLHFLRHLRAKYIKDARNKTWFPERRIAVERLLGRYNGDNLVENSPLDLSGDTSYTLDKGAILAICLRSEKVSADGRHKIYDIDTIKFVFIHELAHIAVQVQNHPPEYWQAFKFLLQEAVACGIMRPRDYGRYPAEYRNTPIDYNPLFDNGLRTLDETTRP